MNPRSLPVWWPVDVGGSVFEVHFKHSTPAEVDRFVERFVRDGLSDSQAAADVVETWREVVDAEGRPLPCTPENLARLVSVPAAAHAIGCAYAARAIAMDPKRAREFNRLARFSRTLRKL